VRAVDKPVAEAVGTVAAEIVGQMSRTGLDSVVLEHNRRHEPVGSGIMLVLIIFR
jgi:hypothetical protein